MEQQQHTKVTQTFGKRDMEKSPINSFLTPLPQKSDSLGFSSTVSSATLVNTCTTLFLEAVSIKSSLLKDGIIFLALPFSLLLFPYLTVP